MTPVSIRPPTMTNRPAKKARVGHSTSASASSAVEPGDGTQQAGAEQGDHDGLVVQHRVQHEPGDDQGEDAQALDQQPRVADGLALVQRITTSARSAS